MKPPPERLRDTQHDMPQNKSAYEKFFKRWERKYAIRLALEKVLDFLSRHKKAVLGTLLVILLAVGLYCLEIWTDYDCTFTGYMLVVDDQYDPQTDISMHTLYDTAPVTLKMQGIICRKLYGQVYFKGQIQMDDFSNYNPFGTHPLDLKIRLPSGWSIAGQEKYCMGTLLLENKAGELMDCVYVLPGEPYSFCFFLWDEETAPGTDRQLQKYYMFPTDTEREAMALLHTLWESLQ